MLHSPQIAGWKKVELSMALSFHVRMTEEGSLACGRLGAIDEAFLKSSLLCKWKLDQEKWIFKWE